MLKQCVFFLRFTYSDIWHRVGWQIVWVEHAASSFIVIEEELTTLKVEAQRLPETPVTIYPVFRPTPLRLVQPRSLQSLHFLQNQVPSFTPLQSNYEMFGFYSSPNIAAVIKSESRHERIIYIYIYIYIYTHTQTHTHTHIYIYIYLYLSRNGK